MEVLNGEEVDTVIENETDEVKRSMKIILKSEQTV